MTIAVCLAVAAIVLGTVAALALCRNGGVS